MTTEETELTFVRCPSCRSLVPAVATRCRMCGYSFESGADADEVEDPAASQSKSRVRQRTISASREQLDELSSGEVEASDSLDNTTPLETPSLFPPQEAEEFEPIAGDPFGSGTFENTPSEEPAVDAGNSEASILESFSAAIMPASESSSEAETSDAGIAVEEPKIFESQEEKPFIEPAEEVQEEVASGENEVSEQEAVAAESSEDSEAPIKKRRRRRRRRKSAVESAEREEVMPTQEGVEMNGVTPQKAKSSKSKKVVTADSGVLVGWFVSFADNPQGEAEELRSGKFFIGRQSLREDDMVIDKEGVSTPHCLIAVGSDGSLKVQDLMSENGTLLQRADGGEFDAVEDVVEIEHGDKLLLGSYEVTICLLPTD